MADPTNRNDPTYANDNRYVWSGGRWQYRSDPVTAEDPSRDPSVTGAGPRSVRASTSWEVGENAKNLRNDLERQRIANFAGGAAQEQSFRQNAARLTAINPYSTGVANQSRGAQIALLEQMRAQQAGPSIASMQSQRAMGQNLQGALGAGAGRGAMLQARNVGAGLAGDTGQAALAEQLRLAGGAGQLVNNMRGADLTVAGQQSQAGLQAQDIADRRARVYAELGRQLAEGRSRSALEGYKLNRRLDKLPGEEGLKAAERGAGIVSTVLPFI